MTEPDEEFIDIDLRPAEDVARRCIVLSALVQYTALAPGASPTSDGDPETAAFDLREWLRSEQLWDELTATETHILNNPLGKLTTLNVSDSVVIGEALFTLAWSLGLGDSLSPHMAPDIRGLVGKIPAPWDATAAWIPNQHLRPEPDIAMRRERAELWAWRLTIEIELRSARGRESSDIYGDIVDVTFEAKKAGLLGADDTDPEGEFQLWHALGEIDIESISVMQVMTEQRLKAFNWVCGFGETWDDVPLDV